MESLRGTRGGSLSTLLVIAFSLFPAAAAESSYLRGKKLRHDSPSYVSMVLGSTMNSVAVTTSGVHIVDVPEGYVSMIFGSISVAGKIPGAHIIDVP